MARDLKKMLEEKLKQIQIGIQPPRKLWNSMKEESL